MPKNAPFRPVRKYTAKTKYPHFKARLPFRAISVSGIIRRSRKEISPSEIYHGPGWNSHPGYPGERPDKKIIGRYDISGYIVHIDDRSSHGIPVR
jgi:hypothetical protein